VAASPRREADMTPDEVFQDDVVLLAGHDEKLAAFTR
jgi:hypothetical protein